MARMSRARFSIRQVFFAVAAVIIFLLLADFNDRWNEKQRLTLQYEQALEELADLEATRTALQEKMEYADSDAAVEAWAYEQGGLVRPGDVVIVRGELTVSCKELELRYDETSQVTWAKGVGGVVAKLRDIRAEAKEASLDLGRNLLVLEGGVRVAQARGARLEAKSATIDLATSKVSLKSVRGALPIPPRRP